MTDRLRESSSSQGAPEVRVDANYKTGFWRKVEDVLLAELYTDFVPRWFKKRTEVRNYETKAAVGWVSPALKLAIGTGLSLGISSFNLGEHETPMAGLCLYFAVDGIYQLLDLRCPYYKDLRKAATLAVDLVTYPFHSVYSKTRYGYTSK